MPTLSADLSSVRLTAVAAQGLLTPPSAPASKEAVLQTIRRLGALQIDTIHVVARSPYLTLFSRLGDYKAAWLDQLLAEGALFEYWAHAACFLPIEDYPIYRRRMLENQQPGWPNVTPEAAALVLARIRQDGPLRSSDFDSTKKVAGGWWNWKDEKRALEFLHTTGELMIARRVNFQRVYDLRERILPDWQDSSALGLEEMQRATVIRAVRAMGVAQPNWVADYFRLHKMTAANLLRSLVDEGQLVELTVDGWADPAYLHREDCSLLEEARSGRLVATHTCLLSPFDSLIWERRRTRALFGFDYSLECYLPAPKRKYGYFVLSILHRGELVGRLDAKAHRKEGWFEVKSLLLEPSVTPDAKLAAEVAEAIRSCAVWHGTPDVRLGRCDPEAFAGLLGIKRSTEE